MREVEAKSILATSNGMWFGMDYNMNLYRGCCHGCIYCDSRSDCYQVEDFDSVRVKKDALKILNRELSSKRKKGVIGIGAMSDSYNPFEKEEEVTRGALKLIEHYGFGISLETKSDLIIRDIDLFKKIQAKNNLILKMTITCAEDALSKIIEPNVCVSSKRFEAIKQLSEAGLFCGVLLTPVLPYITDSLENMRAMVKKSAENGAKFILSMYGVTLRANQREYYYEQLDKHFPNLSFHYRQVYRNNYVCNIPDQKRWIREFEQECKKYGLLYKMNDIVKAYKKEKDIKQLSLF